MKYTKLILALFIFTSSSQPLSALKIPPFRIANVAASTAISIGALAMVYANSTKDAHFLLKCFHTLYLASVRILDKNIPSLKDNDMVGFPILFFQIFIPTYLILGNLIFKSKNPHPTLQAIKIKLTLLEKKLAQGISEEGLPEDVTQEEIQKIFPDKQEKEVLNEAILDILNDIKKMKKDLNLLADKKCTNRSELSNLKINLLRLKSYFKAMKTYLNQEEPEENPIV